MQTKEEIIVGMNALADQVEAMCSEHERDDHEGRMCIANRASAVAFLAHRLGVKPLNGSLLLTVMADYEEHCPHCKEKRGDG